MAPSWYVESRGRRIDYGWLASPGAPETAEAILELGYRATPALELVDSTCRNLLLFEDDRGRLVLLVTGLQPPGALRDNRNRPIRAAVLGVAPLSSPADCQVLVAVAVRFLRGEPGCAPPVRLDPRADGRGFTVAWEQWGGQVAAAAGGLAAVAAATQAGRSLALPDTEDRAREVAGELAAMFVPRDGRPRELARRVIAVRTDRLDLAGMRALWPWRGLGAAIDAEHELSAPSSFDLRKFLVDGGKGLGRAALHEITERTRIPLPPLAILLVLLLAGGLWTALALGGGHGSTGASTAAPAPAMLAAVSCGGPGACLAVGSRNSPGVGRTAAAQSRDGSRWQALRVPAPARGASSLSGVACTSAAVCIAVGGYGATARAADGAAGSLPLAVQITTAGLMVRRLPVPGQAGLLTGIACPVARSCVAVGERPGPGGAVLPLALAWDGRHWQPLAPPAAPGRPVTVLTSVSCWAPGACLAVGYAVGPYGGVTPAADRLDEGRWAALPPLPAAWALRSVSCSSAAACLAAGDSVAAAAPAAAFWNGTAWTLTRPAAAGPGARLNGVSCRPGRCIAVGSATDGTGRIRPLAEAWDGRSWHLVPVASPSPGRADLLAVACGRDGGCEAAGTRGGSRALTERLAGEGFQADASG